MPLRFFSIRSSSLQFFPAFLILIVLINLCFFSFARAQNPAEPVVSASATSPSLNGFPYTKTFEITGYYSPLSGQERYATGNYDAEIRLNGRGTNGASGRQVFPGMIAAPPSYAFGTKMYIPGIGMTSVYDRGGAIVSKDSERGSKTNLRHDRLDIWMGYGDNGLQRALSWGRRTVQVTVHGINDSIKEDVYLEGYSDAEKIIRETFFQNKILPQDVWYLSSGEDVFRLQKILRELGYLPHEPDGFYGDETRDAVFRFQKDQNLVTSLDDLGAGHGGPQTRRTLEQLFQRRKQENIPQESFGIGAKGEKVKKLQKVLALLGYKMQENEIFDEITFSFLAKFQKDQGIIRDENSYGAGYFGPKTREVLEKQYVSFINRKEENLLLDVPEYMVRDLKFGDIGTDVQELQDELRRLHFFRVEPTGNYGELTEHAVFKFQQSQNLVADKSSPGSGVFGSVTRGRMNQLVASRHYTRRMIASHKSQNLALLPEGLELGSRGQTVERLQGFLRQIGFLSDPDVTGFFGEKTKKALMTFQKTHQLISSEMDPGAGRVGPQTKSLIEKFLSTQSAT